MPRRPLRRCTQHGCNTLHRNKDSYCDEHHREWTPGWNRTSKTEEPTKAKASSGRGGRPWRRLRDQILYRDGWLCQCDECKERKIPLVASEVDHITPLHKGGTNDWDNLRAIAKACHKKKTQAESMEARGLKPREKIISRKIPTPNR